MTLFESACAQTDFVEPSEPKMTISDLEVQYKQLNAIEIRRCLEAYETLRAYSKIHSNKEFKKAKLDYILLHEDDFRCGFEDDNLFIIAKTKISYDEGKVSGRSDLIGVFNSDGDVIYWFID